MIIIRAIKSRHQILDKIFIEALAVLMLQLNSRQISCRLADRMDHVVLCILQ
uniref:Uncharacterized protein n=1 Tax=Meloidogyne incognita TaxID=6306 RepID=A0A914LBU7_MELIC